MDIKGWVEAILQNWIADWLSPYIKPFLISFGAGVMAWLRSKNWAYAAPLFYGLVTAVCLYVLLYGLNASSTQPLSPEQQARLEFGQLLQEQELTWHRPRPGGFTKDEYLRLRQEFLKIPRPCVFRITVPPENFNVRRDLSELLTTSFVYRLDSTREFIIEPCKVLSDPKDESPWLYKDQVDYKPEDIIVVNSVPSNSQKAKFVAQALSLGAGLRIRSEFTLLSDGQEDLIHIRVGRGAMRGFETIEIR